MDTTNREAAVQMMQFITAKWISKPIYVVTRLGVPDIVGGGPKAVDEIAAECGAYPPHLYRIMRALVAFGIFRETGERTFGPTPMSDCLRAGAMRSIALMFLSEWHDRAWDKLLRSVTTGEVAFEAAHGMPAFDWLEEHPDEAAVYNEANSIKAATSHGAIVDMYDFSGIETVTDVGGGYGALLAVILEVNPAITGTVADRPSVIERAKETIAAHGLEGRCVAVPCDFFEEIPAGSDAYILSHILHNWPDVRCRAILGNLHRAMGNGSRLLAVEMIVPPGNEPSVAKLLDLEVLVMGGGRERSEAEFRELFETAGFVLRRIIPMRESVCMLECVKK